MESYILVNRIFSRKLTRRLSRGILPLSPGSCRNPYGIDHRKMRFRSGRNSGRGDKNIASIVPAQRTLHLTENDTSSSLPPSRGGGGEQSNAPHPHREVGGEGITAYAYPCRNGGIGSTNGLSPAPLAVTSFRISYLMGMCLLGWWTARSE